MTIILLIVSIGAVLGGAYFVLNNMGLINRKDKPVVEAPYRRPKAILRTGDYGICRVNAKEVLGNGAFYLFLDNNQQVFKKLYYDHEIQPIANHQVIVGNDAPQFIETILVKKPEDMDKLKEQQKLKQELLDVKGKLRYKMEQIDKETDKAVERAEKMKRAEWKAPRTSPAK